MTRGAAAVVDVTITGTMWGAHVRAHSSLSVTFHDGLATARASNAPVNAILAEWATQGRTTIVNADRLGGPPATLELRDVPESKQWT
jgi:hypothetical protein